MYPTYILQVLWGEEWKSLHKASDHEKRQWLSKHMRALAADPDRPTQATAYRIVTPSIHLGEAPTVVERAA